MAGTSFLAVSFDSEGSSSIVAGLLQSLSVGTACRPKAHRGAWRRSKGMNWDQIKGKWNQFKGNAKQQWSKLTDDDLTYVEGARDKLVGRIQERYGVAREEADRQVADWETRQGR